MKRSEKIEIRLLVCKKNRYQKRKKFFQEKRIPFDAEKTEEKSEDVEFRLRRFCNKRNGKEGRQFLKKSMAA